MQHKLLPTMQRACLLVVLGMCAVAPARAFAPTCLLPAAFQSAQRDSAAAPWRRDRAQLLRAQSGVLGDDMLEVWCLSLGKTRKAQKRAETHVFTDASSRYQVRRARVEEQHVQGQSTLDGLARQIPPSDLALGKSGSIFWHREGERGSERARKREREEARSPRAS